MQFRELIIAVDKETQRIVWHTPYREWPRMMPSTAQLAIFPWRGNTDVTNKSIDNLTVKHDRGGLALVDEFPDGAEKDRLLFVREQCILCWRWLIQLHDLRLSTVGLLPGIPLGKAGSNDRKLFEEEQSRMVDVITEEIAQYHDMIWMASDMDELELVATEMASKRHHNRQPYY